MKTIPVVLAAMMVLTNAWAAKDVDLTELDGNYQGNGTFAALGNSYSLTAKVKFDVSKNGRSAKVTLSGLIFGEGGVPWGTSLKLKANGKMSTNNILALDQGGGTFPASGKYKMPKSSKVESTATLMIGTTLVVQDVTMVVEPKGKTKKRLKLNLTVLANGVPYYTYDITATGR